MEVNGWQFGGRIGAKMVYQPESRFDAHAGLGERGTILSLLLFYCLKFWCTDVLPLQFLFTISHRVINFPFSLQSLTVALIFPKCSSLYIILLLKILSSTTSFYSLLPNSLIWYSRVQPTSPILPTGGRNVLWEQRDTVRSCL